MKVIGLHNTGVSSAAALVIDGDLIFACQEERLDRRKHSKYFPHKTITQCLEYAGLDLSEIDHYAIAWNPGLVISGRYRSGLSEWPGHPGERLFSNPNHLLPLYGHQDYLKTCQQFITPDKDISFHYVNHHIAHCAGAFYLSGFDSAALFSCDAYGERATTVWAYGDRENISVLQEIAFPHSIGSFYSAITEYLGFRPDLDEWKTMGAAAYGNTEHYYQTLRDMILFEENGTFTLDLSFFNHFDFDMPGMTTEKFRRAVGFPPRQAGAPLLAEHFNLAAGLQRVVEEYLFFALDRLYDLAPSNRLCLSGGVLMNSVFNGKVSMQAHPFKEIFIPYAPDDSGNCIGAALWLAKQLEIARPVSPINTSPYLGREYSDEQIENTLKQYKITYRQVASPEKYAAELLANEKIIGWFQGRMEFGQRALGNRSILADPRRNYMKDHVNSTVKFRESFRPFAPSIREEDLRTFFDTANFPSQRGIPYMERVLPFKSDVVHLVPAVVHADGTGRVHTVNQTANPRYYALLTHFHQLTGIPLVLNTSFNLSGEPIVESPSDAIRTFFSSGLDSLILGSYVLNK